MKKYRVRFGAGYELVVAADLYRLEPAGLRAFVSFFRETFWGRVRLASYAVEAVLSVEPVTDEK